MAQESTDVSQLVSHLFRHETGKLVAVLTRIFGLEHLGLAEDVVQEALARALQIWPFQGVPENPSAWLMRTARNLALDIIRRQKNFRDKQPEIIHAMERDTGTPDGAIFSEQEIADDLLRMMFVCCHPVISPEAQVALALKTLCGFGITEIGRAFLTSDAAIAKRLVRARQKIHEARIPFEIPSGPELGERLDGVLQSLYLLFNEGYKASAGDNLIRQDICEEAIRLGALLAEHAAGDRPETHALLALMLLTAARTAARTDEAGNLLRLEEQDRTKWDQAMIARGMFHLARSAAGDRLSKYHLQVAIAACHCEAKDYISTDWDKVLALYDRLVACDPSPVVALNRAVALAEARGPQAGLDAINAIQDRQSLEQYYLFYAVTGELELRLGHFRGAAAGFRKAFELADLGSEKEFLKTRLRECEVSQERESPSRLAPVSAPTS
jgi:RNA polymerase sigma factor (sigma-70 family)